MPTVRQFVQTTPRRNEIRKESLLSFSSGHPRPLFPDNVVRSPAALCAIGYVAPDTEGVEPGKAGLRSEEAGEVMFLDVGMFVIAYEKGNPHKLCWQTYLP